MADELEGLPYNATWQQRIQYSFYEAEAECSLPTVLDYSENLPGVHVPFHNLMIILSAVATILCCMICLFTTCGHFFHWVRPQEQRQIVRIILFLPTFSVCSFFSLWFYNASSFIDPLPQLYNAFGIAALFYLFVTLISPDESTWEQFYGDLERRWPTGKVKHTKGSLRWFRMIWVLVFQLLPSQLIVTILLEIHAGISCPLATSNAIWSDVLEVTQFVTTSVAASAAWFYYLRMRPQLKKRHAMLQFNVFQGIVCLQVSQQLMFTLLADYKVYFPTQYVSFRDFSIGVPAFILCWETFIFALLFQRAFHYGEYRAAAQRQTTGVATVARALLDTLDVRDILRGSFLMVTILIPPLGRRYQAFTPRGPTEQSISQELTLLETAAKKLPHSPDRNWSDADEEARQ